MGAKLVPKKSMSFSFDPTARGVLRSNRWWSFGKTIPIRTDVRGLGAHFNTAMKRMRGATLTTRMTTTTRATERLGGVKAPYEKKTKVIGSKMHPKAVYWCQLAPVNDSALR